MTTSYIPSAWEAIAKSLCEIANLSKPEDRYITKEVLEQLEKDYIFKTLKNNLTFGQFFLQETQIFDAYLQFATLTDSPKNFNEQKEYIIKHYVK